MRNTLINNLTPYDQALADFFKSEVSANLILHNNYGEPELMPVEVFFRTEEDFTDIDNIALSFCQGRTLDVGAGTGVHSAVLQAMGIDVTALEISKFACSAMKSIGIKNVINKNKRSKLMMQPTSSPFFLIEMKQLYFFHQSTVMKLKK